MNNDLSEAEIGLLRRIEKEELEDTIVLAHELSQLLAKGLVESTSVVIFPFTIPKKYYRLTVYGKYLLKNLAEK
ncbi:MAG: hypothetical protein Q8J65_07245 [Nitrosomonadales bacterium]|nr:hypothetical protein [Nitrosomonadales bacterium]